MSIFNDKKSETPIGFALGSIEGRVAIQYANPTNPKDNFTFKCHRSNASSGGIQDIYAVSIVDAVSIVEYYKTNSELFSDYQSIFSYFR